MVIFHKPFIFLAIPFFLEMLQLILAASECPLDLTGSNFTLAASICSTKENRAKCCRYINAIIAISIARYANKTSNLGVTSELSPTCLYTITETLALHGVTRNSSIFCAFGTKIPVNYECQGRTTITQMIQSPKFLDVTENCRVPLSEEIKCKKCLNSEIAYLRHLVGAADNLTFSTCRDATFATLASQVDDVASFDLAGCFFGVRELLSSPVSGPTPSLLSPEESPSPPGASSPSQLTTPSKRNENHRSYHLTLVPIISIAIAFVALIMLVFLIILIRRKKRELDESKSVDKATFNPSRQPSKKFQEGPSMFGKFSYKETKKATNNFTDIIGQGGFGTVYKAEFHDGLVVAVKRLDKVLEQAEIDFCREIELLAHLHHRHLVALRGFCIDKNERFLMYEYMANGSLKDHLHTPGKTPLSWHRRIQIAIDVANALEYLHFYCDPPLYHRDIKSSNILLTDDFVAKVGDFGLAHASKDGSVCSDHMNSDITGTPGYMDPEYVTNQDITEKSDVYSYGVVLLELVTGRRAIQDNKNLVEWSQEYLCSESMSAGLVDPILGDSFDFDQLQTLVTIVRWCTQKEGRARPSIKQVLRLLYDCSDPMHDGFIQAIEDEEERGEIEGRGRISRG